MFGKIEQKFFEKPLDTDRQSDNICIVSKAREKGKTMIDYEKAIDKVNAAYDGEDYDKYERLIERYAKLFDYTYNQFEDACTYARIYGHGIS